jgi:hypothetical protein
MPSSGGRGCWTTPCETVRSRGGVEVIGVRSKRKGVKVTGGSQGGRGGGDRDVSARGSGLVESSVRGTVSEKEGGGEKKEGGRGRNAPFEGRRRLHD